MMWTFLIFFIEGTISFLESQKVQSYLVMILPGDLAFDNVNDAFEGGADYRTRQMTSDDLMFNVPQGDMQMKIDFPIHGRHIPKNWGNLMITSEFLWLIFFCFCVHQTNRDLVSCTDTTDRTKGNVQFFTNCFKILDKFFSFVDSYKNPCTTSFILHKHLINNPSYLNIYDSRFFISFFFVI